MKRKELFVCAALIVALVLSACAGESGYSDNSESISAPSQNTDQSKTEKIPEQLSKGSAGLSFTQEGNYYKCTGIGTCMDEDVLIPAEHDGLPVLGISDNAFEGCLSIKSVVIPDSVISIGSNAFNNCIQLKSVVISDSVYTIGSDVFKGCNAIETITIPFVVQNDSKNGCFGWLFGADSYKNQEEYVPTSLKSVIISNACETIPSNAFWECRFLESITIPSSIKCIGYDAFARCERLSEVHIDDISSWCNIDFMCYDAMSPDSNPLTLAKHLYLMDELITNLIIPDNVYCVKDYAFYDANCFSSITVPKNVNTIGDHAFWRSSSKSILTIYYLGTLQEWCGIELRGPLENQCYFLFVEGNLIENINIPMHIDRINNWLFSSLLIDSCTIPNSVTKIGDGAFYGCSRLTSITIPDGVTSIGEDAFYNCSSLVSVTLGNGVTSIGEYAFSGCSGLTSVTIPGSVKSIGEWAFADCNSLTEINFTGTKSQWNSISKGSYWDYGTSSYVVRCTDGDIKK